MTEQGPRIPAYDQLQGSEAMLTVFQAQHPDVLATATGPASAEVISKTPVGDIMDPASAFMVAVLAKARQTLTATEGWMDDAAGMSSGERVSTEQRIKAARAEYNDALAAFEATLGLIPHQP